MTETMGEQFERELHEHVEATMVFTFGAERLQAIRDAHIQHVREFAEMTTEEQVRWIMGEEG